MRTAICGVSAALGLMIAAAPASACGYTVRSAARGQHATRPPVIIGDSTMIFAAPWLGRHGMTADAKECRQFSEGLAMLAARRRAGTLPRLSILALGANGPVSTGMIDRALAVIGSPRLLGLVVPRHSPATEASMRAAARRHRARVLLIDWVAFSAGHSGWFAGDGLHVTPAAGRIYAGFIARAAAPVAAPPIRALHPPRHSRAATDCGVAHQLGRPLGVKIIRGAGRVRCRVARALARRTPVEPLSGWRAYWWKATGHGPWIDLYARQRGRLLVGTIPARR